MKFQVNAAMSETVPDGILQSLADAYCCTIKTSENMALLDQIEKSKQDRFNKLQIKYQFHHIQFN